MIRVSSRLELDESLDRLRTPGARVAFVPTMGYLHEGHASLIRLARQTADVVVVSIFVNPKQFGPSEDLDRYPRDLDRDQALCDREGVDLLFTPTPDVVYPPGFATEVAVSGLTDSLCGASRPGHFAGVTTVLARLFGDLAMPVEVVRAPLLREADGLALSSRNTDLSAEDRSRALALSRALAQAMRAYLAGERSAERLLAAARSELAGVDLEYLELRDADSLAPVAALDAPAVMVLAAKVGKTRLIDNALLAPDSPDRGLSRLLEGAAL